MTSIDVSKYTRSSWACDKSSFLFTLNESSNALLNCTWTSLFYTNGWAFSEVLPNAKDKSGKISVGYYTLDQIDPKYSKSANQNVIVFQNAYNYPNIK